MSPKAGPRLTSDSCRAAPASAVVRNSRAALAAYARAAISGFSGCRAIQNSFGANILHTCKRLAVTNGPRRALRKSSKRNEDAWRRHRLKRSRNWLVWRKRSTIWYRKTYFYSPTLTFLTNVSKRFLGNLPACLLSDIVTRQRRLGDPSIFGGWIFWKLVFSGVPREWPRRHQDAKDKLFGRYLRGSLGPIVHQVKPEVRHQWTKKAGEPVHFRIARLTDH